jgi:ADP-dependent NAD(P)H-hydrate dehydratase / NAD(P)H-hydrate epimerase
LNILNGLDDLIMIVVTAEQMREMDRLTIHKYGTPSLTLMERAGAGVVKAILECFAKSVSKGVLIVAGKGNNGGDGFVVGRLLREQGVSCAIALLANPNEISRDAAHNLERYLTGGGKVVGIDADHLGLLKDSVAGKGLLVDALLGTGTNNEIRGMYADAIRAMNGSGLPIVAIDIPSGLDADKGTPLGVCVQAAMTVALGYPKLGQVIYPAVEYVGELVVADIGIEPAAVSEVARAAELLNPQQVRSLVPVRKPDSHKGTYGHVVVIAGSRGKTGAAILASRACMRGGAGLTTLAAPRSLNNVFAGALIEVMTEPLRDTVEEEIESLTDDEWRRLLEHKTVALFGPGIGVTNSTRNNLRWLLRHLALPWVIDADGLNNLALDLDRLRKAKTAPILTPHPGEMGRLIGKDASSVNKDRVGVAHTFATEHGCYVVLKGARSVLATPAGKVFINPTGNPGMASGGMGDVLAGILAALLAQGLSPEEAMKLGVYLHGFVADRICSERGMLGMIASDIIDGLPAGFRSLSAAA